MLIKLIVFPVIMALWAAGGQKCSWARDVLVPIVMGATIGYFLPGVLLWKIVITIASIGTFNIIRLGYGNYSPEDDPKPSFLASITHDRKGWWIRGIYGLITAAVSALPIAIFTGRWWIYVAYALVLGVGDFTIVRQRWTVLRTDLCIGALRPLVLFMV